MRGRTLSLAEGDWAAWAIGATFTLAAVLAAQRVGAAPSLGGLLALMLFTAVVAGFVAAPHLVVAALIPYFAVLPTLKVLIGPELGPSKDVIVLAAATAVVVVAIRRGAHGLAGRVDPYLGALAALFVALYIVNAGGLLGSNGFDLAWLQGIRLVTEPLLLLVVGLSLDNPRKTAHWAVASLVITACAVACIGIAQQLVGEARLLDLGYSYEAQIRTIAGRLRSFGTMDDPFSYAAFLMLALAATLLWPLPRVPAAWAGVLIATGITVAYVRSALIVSVALLGIWLARHRFVAPGILFVGAAAVAAMVLLVGTTGATQTQTVQGASPLVITLNGRAQAWDVAVGSPSSWAFGRGVAEVGTAAERATYAIARPIGHEENAGAVDSGYFATIADVGLVGLVVLLALFGRIAALAFGGIRRDEPAAWLALAMLAILMLDAVTRASFTGFPFAFLGLFLIGLMLAASRAEPAARPEPAPSAT